MQRLRKFETGNVVLRRERHDSWDRVKQLIINPTQYDLIINIIDTIQYIQLTLDEERSNYNLFDYI